MLRRRILLVVAAFLSASALLAVGILLFGHFGRTEGRILSSTALVAAAGLAVLPAALLLDRRRLPLLTVVVATLAGAAFTLALVAVWSPDEPPEGVGRALATALVWLAATDQTASLVLRRGRRDPASVRRLFAASVVLSLALAGVLTGVVWTEAGSSLLGRLVGAALVVDVLAVALQPILALARPRPVAIELVLRLEGGRREEVRAAAPDVATAVARAIRGAERRGQHVTVVELPPPERAPAVYEEGEKVTGAARPSSP